MDPNSAQILDPKLKEAYDRVMGSAIPTPAAPAPMQPAMPSNPMQPAAGLPLHREPIEHTLPVQPQPAMGIPVQPAHAQPAIQNTQASQQHSAPTSFSSAYIAPHPASHAGVSGKLLIIAGVIFLIVYTLFWMKWFGMPLPFLP